jgi:EpsI family protein
VIFISCVAILFGIAAGLQRLRPEPKPLSESIDLDFSGLGEQLRRAGAIAPSAALATATAATALMAAAWYAAPAREIVRPERAPLAAFPSSLGDWRGAERPISEEIRRVLGADDHLAITFAPPEGGGVVDLFVAYYHKLTEGSGIHSPEVCIPAGGWEVSAWEARTVRLDDAARTELPVNRAVIRKGRSRQLVWYWFEQRGRRITSDYAAKFYNVRDSLLRGRTDGALVRLVTPLAPGESPEAASARLRAVLSLAMPQLGRHLPE